MKAFRFYLLLCGILCSATAYSQITKLKNLNDFNKIILKGDVSEIDVSRSHDGQVVIIEGVENENVKMSLEAGTLTLTLKDTENALVHVFNSELNRIEGKDGLIISGADYIGSNGKFLIRGFNDGHHNSYSFNGSHGFNFNFDHDFDMDLNLDIDELDDLDLSVNVDIKDHDWDWNWNWQWDWNWEDHRNEFRSHPKDLKRDLKEIKEDLKEDLKDLKRELKEYK